MKTCRFFAPVLLIALAFVSTPGLQAATLSDCGFENSNAQDGTWNFGVFTETEVTYGGTWTSSISTNVGTAHSGTGALRFNLTGHYIIFAPAAPQSIGFVNFWWSSNTSNSTLELQYSTDGGTTWSDGLSGNPAPLWSQSVTTTNAYANTGPIAVYQPGNTILRWIMTARSSGAIFVDDVQILDTASTPTPTITPTQTPTATPCNGYVYNCGFESGSLAPWVTTGGGSVNFQDAGHFCGGTWPYEGTYAFWNVANFSNINGSLRQVVTPSFGVTSVTAACYARNADGCQNSFGTVEVGIDPTAGSDPSAGTVQYGTAVNLNDTQQQVTSPSVAVSGNYTIFIRYNVTQGPTSWAFVNIDAVSVSEVGALPSPTPTPTGPTPTPSMTPVVSSVHQDYQAYH